MSLPDTLVSVDKNLDASYTTYPWGWHPRYVGRWLLEVPLNRDKIGVFGHGCLLDVLTDFFGITGDMFFPTQLESPCRHPLFDRPVPLPPGIIREALDRQWSLRSMRDDRFVPECELFGLSRIWVNNPGGMVRAPVPHALCFRLEGELGGESPTALFTIYTKCDAWLERTLDGHDNAAIGRKNSEILTAILGEIEGRLCGVITDFATEYDSVEVEKHGLRNKLILTY